MGTNDVRVIAGSRPIGGTSSLKLVTTEFNTCDLQWNGWTKKAHANWQHSVDDETNTSRLDVMHLLGEDVTRIDLHCW